MKCLICIHFKHVSGVNQVWNRPDLLWIFCTGKLVNSKSQMHIFSADHQHFGRQSKKEVIFHTEKRRLPENVSEIVKHLYIKASAHSFKQFTSRLLKSTFSLSLCTYITRMDVMLDFICMGPVDLPGARPKRQNTKWKISCPQWDSNPQPFDSESDALPTELAGLGECYPFKWPYYIHVLPILM